MRTHYLFRGSRTSFPTAIVYVYINTTAKDFLFDSFGGVVSMTVHFSFRCVHMEVFFFLEGCWSRLCGSWSNPLGERF